MKSFLFLKRWMIIPVVSGIFFSSTAYATNVSDVIPIEQRQSTPEGAPRSSVPFYAEFNETLSSVILGCNDSIGDVTVTLTSTAGDWYQTEFDTSEGAILIPASGDAGYYTLTIETAAHVVYEGEFYL